MQDSSKAKMYVAANRRHTETEGFRSYATFYKESSDDENRAAFRSLYVLNDDTLAAGRSKCFESREDTFVVLLPVVGVITYQDDAGNTGPVLAGEAVVLSLAKGNRFELLNPLQTELVNYLQLWFSASSHPTAAPRLFSFDIDTNKNGLIPIFEQEAVEDTRPLPASIFIGKFSGRGEAVYNISQACNGVFIFVLQGAFEVQYRLLEARDGLAVWDVNEVELEALSNDAILLLIELPAE